MEYVLVHHGIKGMKWGVRRYRNEDGTLTALGKRRLVGSNLQSRPTTADLKKAKKLASESSEMSNKLKKLNEDASKISDKSKPKMDLSNMSDKQMRDEINRAMLEKQYNDLFAPQKVNKGREHVNDTLTIVGDVLTVTSTALSIAVLIRELKKGNGGSL